MILSVCDNTIEAFKIIGIFLYIAKVVVPIIIIIFAIKDVSTIIMQGNEESIKKSFSSFIKRLAAGLIIFLIPTIIPNIIKLLKDDYESENTSKCQICLFEPFSNDCNTFVKEFKDSLIEERVEFDDLYVEDGSINLADLDDAIIPESEVNTTKPNGSSVKNGRERATGKREAFLQAWDNISNQLEIDVQNGIDWHWGGGVNATFKKSRRLGNYKTYCGAANYWALKDGGVIPKDKFIYGCRNLESKNMTEEEVNNAFIIIMGDGRTARNMIKTGDLIAGDTVYWRDSCHTNAYAGNELWFDAGRNYSNGYGSADNYHLTTLGPLRLDIYLDSVPYKVLRIREN